MLSTGFTVLITTKNRLEDLTLTLEKSKYLLGKKDVQCIICDDGSIDGTASFIKKNYPEIKLIQNRVSKGLIYSRNRLLSLVITEYAISLDDDAHFVTQNPLPLFLKHFEENANCGLIALRLFWGLDLPAYTLSSEKATPVQGFVGCGHVWRMKAWRAIPKYPEWFVFHGEESFASYHLFKQNWSIYYLPEVLVHHRVDIKSRKNNPDYTIRLRQSLRSGWYLFFLFMPIYLIPRKMAYSIWMQLKLKVLHGDWKALKALLLAMIDLFMAVPKIIKNSNRLTKSEFALYEKLPRTKIYWNPERNSKDK